MTKTTNMTAASPAALLLYLVENDIELTRDGGVLEYEGLTRIVKAVQPLIDAHGEEIRTMLEAFAVLSYRRALASGDGAAVADAVDSLGMTRATALRQHWGAVREELERKAEGAAR